MNEEENSCEPALDHEPQKKQSLFLCTKISKYFIIPFLTPIFCMLGNILIVIYLNLIKSENANEPDYRITFLHFLIFILPKIFGGSLYFIYKKNNPEISEDTTENENMPEQNKRRESLLIIIFNKLKKQRLINAIKLISIIALIFSICDFIEINIIQDKKNFDVRLSLLIFTSIFSVVFFNQKIYKHQKLSLAISICGMIIVFSSNIIFGFLANSQSKNDYSWYIMLIITFVEGIIVSFMLVLSKYTMEILFISPFQLLFILGIFELIFGFILNIVYFLIIGEDIKLIFTSIIYAINGKNLIESIIYLIIIFIIVTIFFILEFSTVYFFSPSLFVITDLFSPLFQLIFAKIKFDEIKNKEFILSIIGYIICITASLFYNELIICNFCGLSENTAENIRRRGQEDQLESLIKIDESQSSIEINSKSTNYKNQL